MNVGKIAAGRLIRYDELRGYGFITPDQGSEDIFVHVNDLEMNKSLFVPGARVEFQVDEGDRGLKASSVRLAESTREDGAESQVSPPPAASAAPGEVCDVVKRDELEHEVTEVLLVAVPDLAARDVLVIREMILGVAVGHNWIES